MSLTCLLLGGGFGVFVKRYTHAGCLHLLRDRPLPISFFMRAVKTANRPRTPWPYTPVQRLQVQFRRRRGAQMRRLQTRVLVLQQGAPDCGVADAQSALQDLEVHAQVQAALKCERMR